VHLAGDVVRPARFFGQLNSVEQESRWLASGKAERELSADRGFPTPACRQSD